MKLSNSLAFLLIVLFAVLATPIPSQASDKSFEKLMVTEWDYEMQHNPVWASVLGDRRWNDRWDDLSLAGIQRDDLHRKEVLKQLKTFDPAKLSPANRLNRDLLIHLYSTWIEEDGFRWYLVPESHATGLPEDFRMRTGVQSAAQLATTLRFEQPKDFEDWNARLASFGRYVDQVIALMRQGIRVSMVQPKSVATRIPGQIEKQLVARAEESAFYTPFVKMPATVPASQQTQLAAQARTNIEQTVQPALKRFRDFLVSEYIPAAPETVGAWQWPHGPQMYSFFVRKYTTTTNLTPDQVHELGLVEVKRIRSEMEALMRQTGFNGTLKDFFHFLRTDKRFYYTDPQELLLQYRNLAKTIDPRLLKIAKTLPRAPYGVEPTPAEVAPDATTGFYYAGAPDGSRPGTYLVNLYRPETRPKWEMVSLTLHEAMPGHHLQTALAMEMADMPNFRRFGSYMAFVEGWALYCETHLGYDLGMFNDPYDRFGQLAFEMWRAVRLVVDTGMHSKHWTRQQAIDYFLENTPRQELDVTNEVDRYIAWPGQALAYKIGELKISELRKSTEQQLGPKFDLRAFNDEVLGAGPLPLSILEQRINTWTATQKTK
ncbi:MAG TPA: DUF885 domain-containing protein [Terriglobales bacterium]|nr:DUF885 domain-containing protein [Terriglobales bacterium]